jgi:hypothetical protein
MLAARFPSWLDSYSGITIEYVGSGAWPCHGEAAVDPPTGGDTKPRARLKLYDAYCEAEPVTALAHLLLHYEPVNRQLFLEGGESQRKAESDAETFGKRWSASGWR